MFSSKYRLHLATVALALPLAALAAPQYAYTAVGLSDAKGGAYALSNSGNVAGTVSNTAGSGQGFLYTHNQFIPLGSPPGFTDNNANGVNNAGQVVGQLYGPAGNHAYLYDAGSMIDLGSLEPSGAAVANDINDAGQVAGWSASASGTRYQAFVYSNGVMHGLGFLPGGTYSYANAINNSGQVTGSSSLGGSDPGYTSEHAFLYDHGVMKDLGTLGGAISKGFGINDAGQVAGVSYTILGNSQDFRAFLYANGAMRDLGTVVPGANSWARGINNRGQVVGWYDVGTGRAFIWDQGNGMRDLNAMVDPSTGWFIHAAYRINDRQQIVALGCKNGQYGAVLLEPTHLDGLTASPPADSAPPQRPQAGAPENAPCAYG